MGAGTLVYARNPDTIYATWIYVMWSNPRGGEVVLPCRQHILLTSLGSSELNTVYITHYQAECSDTIAQQLYCDTQQYPPFSGCLSSVEGTHCACLHTLGNICRCNIVAEHVAQCWW